MQSSLLDKYKHPIKKAPNSEWAEQINAVCELMGFTTMDANQSAYKRQFRMWCGRLRKKTPEAIYLLLQEAKTGRNPKAFFQWLLKKSA